MEAISIVVDHWVRGSNSEHHRLFRAKLRRLVMHRHLTYLFTRLAIRYFYVRDPASSELLGVAKQLYRESVVCEVCPKCMSSVMFFRRVADCFVTQCMDRNCGLVREFAYRRLFLNN